MRRVLLTAGVLVLLVGMLQGCSVAYYRTAYKPNPDRHVTEFGLLGFPENEATGECAGLVPLWRSSSPASAPISEE